MSKSHVLFSLALGGLVLAGCSKDETPTPSPTQTPTTVPSTPTPTPAPPAPSTSGSGSDSTTKPASAPSAAADGVKPGNAAAAPTTSPALTDANK